MRKRLLCVAALATTLVSSVYSRTDARAAEPDSVIPVAQPAIAAPTSQNRSAARINGRKRAAPQAPRKYEDYQVAAGTYMEIELRTSLAASTSQVQDEIRGRLTLPLSVDGVEVVPEGATVRGVVTVVERSDRVRGLARLAFRFSVLEHPTTGSRVGIRTATIIREARAPKKAKKKEAEAIDVQIPSGTVVAARLEEPFLVRIPSN